MFYDDDDDDDDYHYYYYYYTVNKTATLPNAELYSNVRYLTE